MSDSSTYPVHGNIDFLTEQAIVDVLRIDDTMAAVFGSPSAVNIRRTKDTTKGDNTLPAIGVEALPEQSIPRSNEYHMRITITCVTHADKDTDGQQVQALAGAVRDSLHKDSTPSYSGHFAGDCEGFLEALNDTERDIVFHQVHEMGTDEEDDGRIRRRSINLDAWCYPGRIEE